MDFINVFIHWLSYSKKSSGCLTPKSVLWGNVTLYEYMQVANSRAVKVVARKLYGTFHIPVHSTRQSVMRTHLLQREYLPVEVCSSFLSSTYGHLCDVSNTYFQVIKLSQWERIEKNRMKEVSWLFELFSVSLQQQLSKFFICQIRLKSERKAQAMMAFMLHWLANIMSTLCTYSRAKARPHSFNIHIPRLKKKARREIS